MLYFASSSCIALSGPGNFSIDEVITRTLKSEENNINETNTINNFQPKNNLNNDIEKKEGFFQFLQDNLLSDISS